MDATTARRQRALDAVIQRPLQQRLQLRDDAVSPGEKRHPPQLPTKVLPLCALAAHSAGSRTAVPFMFDWLLNALTEHSTSRLAAIPAEGYA